MALKSLEYPLEYTKMRTIEQKLSELEYIHENQSSALYVILASYDKRISLKFGFSPRERVAFEALRTLLKTQDASVMK